MKTLLTIPVLVIFLTGCAPTMGNLKPAPKWCTATGKSFPDLKAGDDLVERDAALIRLNREDASKLRCLRRYVKAVSQK